MEQKHFPWKTIPIYICSTLRDMHAERELLIKYVLPELCEWGKQWKLQIIDSDIICYHKGDTIEKIRDIYQQTQQKPIFIFLLGNNCLWWGKHQTQLENLAQNIYDLLETLHEEAHLLLYVRRSENFPVSETDCPDLKNLHEIFSYHLIEDSQKIIDFLQQSILKSKIFHYTAEFDPILENPEDPGFTGRFTLESLQKWLQQIKTHLKELMTSSFQSRISSIWEYDSWQRETNAHEAFVQLHTFAFINKPEMIDIKNYIDDDSSHPLFIYGEEGSGKSALLAKMYQNILETPESKVIGHFVGASSQSHSLDFLLSRLCQEIKRICNLDIKIPIAKADCLITVFKQLLIDAESPIVIIIDGLNHLQLETNKTQLYWLLTELPHSHKMLISAGGDLGQKLYRQTTKNLAIFALKEEQKRQFIKKVSQLQGQKFTNKHIKALATLSDNPLYLKIAIRELRSIPSHSLLLKIQQLPVTTEQLFDSLLQKLEQAYTPELVEMLFSLIYCSRYGLTRQELRELLLAIDDTENWQIVIRHVQDHIHLKGKLVSFFHLGFAQAVEKRYLQQDKEEWHRYLAEYFAEKPTYSGDIPNRRKLIELVWQQLQSKMDKEVVTTLTDFEFLEARIYQGMILKTQYEFEHAANIVDGEWEIIPQIKINRQILKLLGRILELEIELLYQFPKTFFQTLWNYGYWHDSPDAQHHYYPTDDNAPWLQNGQLHHLVEYWRQIRKTKTPWLKSLRPLPTRLDSPLLKTIYAHTASILNVCFSSDGMFIASSSWDHTVKIWNASSGQLFQDLSRDPRWHRGSIESICLHPHKKKLAIAFEKRVEVWNFIDMGERELLTFEKNKVGAMEFDHISYSPDGKRLAAAGYKNQKPVVVILCLETQDIVTQIWRYRKQVKFAPTGDLLVIDDIRDIPHIYNLKDESDFSLKKELNTTGAFLSTCFSPDGKKIALGTEPGSIYFFDIENRKLLYQWDHKNTKGVYAIDFSPDGKKIASGAWDGTIRLWDAITGEHLHCYQGHKGQVYSLVFSPDGSKIASGSWDGTIRIWDAESYNLTRKLVESGNQNQVRDPAISNTANKIITRCGGKNVNIWDTYTGYRAHNIALSQPVRDIKLASDEHAITCDGRIQIWSAINGKLIHAFPNDASHIQLSKNGQEIAISDKIYNIKNQQVVAQLDHHLTHLVMGVNETVFIGTNEKATLFFFNVQTQLLLEKKIPQTISWKQTNATALDISPENQLVVIGCDNGEVWLWNPHTESIKNVPSEHTNKIVAIIVSPDGEKFISLDSKKTACVSNIISQKCEKQFHHQGNIDNYFTDFTYIKNIALGIIECTRDNNVFHFSGVTFSETQKAITKRDIIAVNCDDYLFLLQMYEGQDV